MKRNTTLILTFLLSGLILIGIAFLISKWLEDSPSTAPLATIEKISDHVYIFRKHLTQKETLGRKSMVHELETIETGADGEAILDFSNGFRLKVLPSTEITLDKEIDKSILYIKAGDVRIETAGREGSLFISKDGVRKNASEYETLGNDNETVKYQDRPVSEGLTPSYIMMILSAQKSIFYRCYTQLLQKNPKMSGDASISLTIEPTGKVSRSEVTSTNLDDSTFKKCLVEATNRIEFKAFSGGAVTTVFPLKFE